MDDSILLSKATLNTCIFLHLTVTHRVFISWDSTSRTATQLLDDAQAITVRESTLVCGYEKNRSRWNLHKSAKIIAVYANTVVDCESPLTRVRSQMVGFVQPACCIFRASLYIVHGWRRLVRQSEGHKSKKSPISLNYVQMCDLMQGDATNPTFINRLIRFGLSFLNLF